tara:strand:+ start:249 stop:473 length:225 start_codon:yes stop_codon:yes gene_type:complete
MVKMMITLDNMADRYGILPSEALARANTMDLAVLDVSAKFSAYQQTDKYKNNKGRTDKELLRMIEGVKNAKQKS